MRPQGRTLNLDFEDGSTMEIQTIGPTSSVIVWERNGTMEDAD